VEHCGCSHDVRNWVRSVMQDDLCYILRRTGLEQEVKSIVLTCSLTR